MLANTTTSALTYLSWSRRGSRRQGGVRVGVLIRVVGDIRVVGHQQPVHRHRDGSERGNWQIRGARSVNGGEERLGRHAQIACNGAPWLREKGAPGGLTAREDAEACGSEGRVVENAEGREPSVQRMNAYTRSWWPASAAS